MNSNTGIGYMLHMGLQDFAKRWGLEPNGILMNPRLFNTLSEVLRREQVFEGVAIYRSPDIKDNEIRFII